MMENNQKPRNDWDDWDNWGGQPTSESNQPNYQQPQQQSYGQQVRPNPYNHQQQSYYYQPEYEEGHNQYDNQPVYNQNSNQNRKSMDWRIVAFFLHWPTFLVLLWTDKKHPTDNITKIVLTVVSLFFPVILCVTTSTTIVSIISWLMWIGIMIPIFNSNISKGAKYSIAISTGIIVILLGIILTLSPSALNNTNDSYENIDRNELHTNNTIKKSNKLVYNGISIELSKDFIENGNTYSTEVGDSLLFDTVEISAEEWNSYSIDELQQLFDTYFGFPILKFEYRTINGTQCLYLETVLNAETTSAEAICIFVPNDDSIVMMMYANVSNLYNQEINDSISSIRIIESNKTRTENNSEKQYIKVDIQTIIDELDSNALKAERAYQDQYVEFTGKIKNIDSEGQYISVESLDADNWNFDSIHCSLKTEDQRNIIMEKAKGQQVTIQGKITSIGEVFGYSVDIENIR